MLLDHIDKLIQESALHNLASAARRHLSISADEISKVVAARAKGDPLQFAQHVLGATKHRIIGQAERGAFRILNSARKGTKNIRADISSTIKAAPKTAIAGTAAGLGGIVQHGRVVNQKEELESEKEKLQKEIIKLDPRRANDFKQNE